MFGNKKIKAELESMHKHADFVSSKMVEYYNLKMMLTKVLSIDLVTNNIEDADELIINTVKVLVYGINQFIKDYSIALHDTAIDEIRCLTDEEVKSVKNQAMIEIQKQNDHVICNLTIIKLIRTIDTIAKKEIIIEKETSSFP